MKKVLLASLLALAGCHSRNDAGPFEVHSAEIAPMHDGVVHSLIYRKPILLTFDDGPENAADDLRILATLARHNAHALWLVTCNRLDPAVDAQAEAHRSVLRQIVASGHMVGNHGYSHVDVARLDSRRLQREIVDCSGLIARLTGKKPIYFRPPFGSHSPSADRFVQARGMHMLLWSSNSFDSLFATFKQHPQRYPLYLAQHPEFDVSTHTSPGDVLLFHDYPNTALVLDGILARLEQQGFQFVLPQRPGYSVELR